ncbi:MAG: MOSC domain-containing protein [Candidatus Acidiferrum sp.]
MAKVTNLFRAPKRHAAMKELNEAQVIENFGIEGCAHARPGGKRQVLLMDIETLRALYLAPGIIRENITTEGLDVNGLQVEQKLRSGEVELEVSAVCEPCELMEEIRIGLMEELNGRRGMLCRVKRGGRLRVGDFIELLAVVEEVPSSK